MTATHAFAPGGYRFIPGVFPYSGGVAALPGHEIQRVRFHTPVPLAEGFVRIRNILAAAGRPLTALCACAFTVPAADAPPSFVVAGSGEVPEGHKDYFDRIIARGDVSPQGLRRKARFVLGEMQRRLSALGFGWHDTTATQVYTVHDLYPFLAEEIVRRGAARAGLTWHFARPPVVELEYEMDCRGVGREEVII